MAGSESGRTQPATVIGGAAVAPLAEGAETWTFRPGNGVFVWLAVIAAGMPMALIWVLGYTGSEPVPPTAWLLGPGITLTCAALMSLVIRRNSLTLSSREVSVRSSFYRFSVAPAHIDPASIRRVDFLVDRSWQPRLRTNGVGLPGYRSGWFRLVDRSRAFLAVAGVAGLGFRTRDGVAVVVSTPEIDRAEARLQALVAAASA